MRPIFMCCVAIIFVFSIAGCVNQKKEGNGNPLEANATKLQDIAFKAGKGSQCRIYIEEGGEMTPYLVLTDDYNGDGNCLLLRENLLDEPMRYNPNGWYASYYENCELEVFLNGKFYESLSETVAPMICDSEIDITAKESLGIGGKTVTSITRKVFLLSYTEVNESGSRVNLTEGVPLEYFSDIPARIACYSNGEAGSWTLRTPSTAYRNVVCGVSLDGAVGVGGIGSPEGEYTNGVRPAFCLPRDTPIEKFEVDGEKVYGIEN